MKQDIGSVVSALGRFSPVVLDVPAEIRYVLLQRYVEMSIRNARLGFASFALLLLGLAHEAPLLPRLAALVLFIFLLIWRVRVAKQVLVRMNPADPHSSREHDALVLMTAVFWAAAPYAFEDSVSALNLYAVIYAAFVALAVLSISYFTALPASVLLGMGSLVPLVAYMLLQRTLVFDLLALATLICATTLASRVRDGHRILLQALAAERENALLVKELQSYRQRLEIENAMLGNSLRDASAAASRDPLTGLFNRRHLVAYACPLAEVVDNHREAVSVCMVDIDHFKSINDRHGHAVGDQVLRAVAGLLGTRLRDADCLARFGGEEFVVVLRRCDINRARRVAEALRHNIASADVETVAGVLAVTVSLGVAQWAAGEGLDDVMQRADRALYRAKQTGRDRLEIDAGDALRLRKPPVVVEPATIPGSLH